MSSEQQGLTLSSEEVHSASSGKIHPMAELGLALFNDRQYWKAHEALEEAWKFEPGPVRHLYLGILQAGVAYLHIQKGNYTGAMKMYSRSQRWLSPFPNECRGIAVAQLRHDLEVTITILKRIGPQNISQFDQNLLKPIFYTSNVSRHHP